MADGRHVGKYSKCHNSPNSGPTVTQLGWSHPIMFSTCPPCYGYHGNDRCLAPVHCTFSGYGRLETEHVNLFRWNLVHNSMLGSQSQSRDQILKFLKFKMADGRHLGKYWKYHNLPSNGPIGTKLGWSHPVTFPTCPPQCSCHGNRNDTLDIQQLWASGGRTRKPILMKFGIQQHIRTIMTVTWSNIKIFKIQNGGRSLLENIRNAITRLPMNRLGRNLGCRIPSCSQYWKCYNCSYDGTNWDDSWVQATQSAAEQFPWYWSLLLTAQWTWPGGGVCWSRRRTTHKCYNTSQSKCWQHATVQLWSMPKPDILP